MTPRQSAYGVRPPEPAAEGVAWREAGRETSAAADDPPPPVRWMDAPPGPWRKDTRGPIAATKKPGRRGEDADARQGTARRVLCAAPLSGLRHATARPRRTQGDGASAVAPRLETRSGAGEEVPRVCATLPTHTKGAF
jgi:hypothetical protein